MNGGIDAVALGQRLVAVLEMGQRTATYKLATLQALMDHCIEHVPAEEAAAVSVPLAHLAGRVVEAYWYQVRPFEGHELRQSTQPVSRILRAVSQLRTAARQKGVSGPLARVPDLLPAEYGRAVREVAITLVRQPLNRLQRLPGGCGRDTFLYDDSWMTDAVSWREIQARGATVELFPGVGFGLARLSGLLRPVIQLLWTEDVRRLNRATIGTDVPDIAGHLFGRSRMSLEPARVALLEAFGPHCFYCGTAVESHSHVDHVLPWSRVGIDGLANLVVACARCNGDKTNALPAPAWVSAALDRPQRELDALAATINWPVQWNRTRNAARGLYRAEPTGSATWVGYHVIEPLVIADPAPYWFF